MVTTAEGLSHRRQEIVTHAAKLFDEAGYHATNMTELARSVGVEKATLYHYFSGKHEILFWIHDEYITLMLAKAALRQTESLSASDELHSVIGDLFELMSTHRGHIRVFHEHARELSAADEATIRVKRDQYRHHVESIIERGVRDGEFHDLDPRLTTLALFGMCTWAYQWFRADGPLTAPEVADFFFDLITNGLARRTQPDDRATD